MSGSSPPPSTHLFLLLLSSHLSLSPLPLLKHKKQLSSYRRKDVQRLLQVSNTKTTAPSEEPLFFSVNSVVSSSALQHRIPGHECLGRVSALAVQFVKVSSVSVHVVVVTHRFSIRHETQCKLSQDGPTAWRTSGRKTPVMSLAHSHSGKTANGPGAHAAKLVLLI